MSNWRPVLFTLIISTFLGGCAKEACPYVDERMCDRDFRDSIAALEPDTSGGTLLPDTGIVQGNRVIFDPELIANTEQNAFLEYYTGFRCTNCPPASATARNIKDEFGSRVVLAFMHVTSTFAAPLSDPPAMYSTDMRTEEGEVFVSSFQISGIPGGIVNRKGFGSSLATSAGNWQNRIESELSQPAGGFLRIRKVEWNSANRTARVQIAYRVLSGATEDYNLTIGAFENGIIEAQKSGAENLYPYTHNYVFRGHFNGLYGEELSAANPILAPGETIFKEITINIDPEWIENEMMVFAYLHHRNDRFIIQTTEAKLVQ